MSVKSTQIRLNNRDIYELIFPISKFPPKNWYLEFSTGAKSSAFTHSCRQRSRDLYTHTSQLSHGNSFPGFKLDPEPQTQHRISAHLLGLRPADRVRKRFLLLLDCRFGEKIDKLLKIHGWLFDRLPYERMQVPAEENRLFIQIYTSTLADEHEFK